MRVDAGAGRTAAIGRAALARDLRALGVRPGQRVLVHASLRGIGRVEGGAATVAAALTDVIGSAGTIVVPAITDGNSDTSRTHLARTAGMTDAQRRRYLAAMPAFDPASTPSTGMGALAEHIRTAPGALRSGHPQTSFAALGPDAARLVGGHAADCHYGEESPLARLYETDARILLLGVGHECCTAFHLSEYRYTARPATRRYNCVVDRGGRPAWWSYEDVVLDDRDFAELGRAFDLTGHVMRGRVGRADSRSMPLRRAVDFATAWLAARRPNAR